VSGTHAASLFADIGMSWPAQFGSLLVLPLANEDLAIVTGAYIVVNDLMPVALVALGIYGGMVTSDVALYGIGAGARRLPWLGRYAIGARVREFGEVLTCNLFGLVTICRLVPGAVFVVFVACGWARVSFTRFMVATLVTSALYLPIVLYLVVVFGEALDDRAGLWAWPLLFAALLAAGFMLKRVLAFREVKPVRPVPAGRAPATGDHSLLAGLSRKAAFGQGLRPLPRQRPLPHLRRNRWSASSGGRPWRAIL
jgi:membrane protein DedA with SNARE-associated domain